MARPKKTSVSSEAHHGVLAAVEKQYLAALKYSRDQINKRIIALEGMSEASSPTPTAKAATGPVSGGGKSSGKKKPRNYDLLKEKITSPMTIIEILKALDMKPKQEGTIRQTMQNYPGLLKSDGKRPATYTLDTSR